MMKNNSLLYLWIVLMFNFLQYQILQGRDPIEYRR